MVKASAQNIGRFERVHVELYESHAVICSRVDGSGWFGIELEENAHEWNTPTLQSAACTRLGLPGDLASRIAVIDYTTFEPPEGFYN